MKYAGILLLAGRVARPAEHGAVVHFRDRPVCEDALGMSGRVLVTRLRHVLHLLGIVKGPTETLRRWIRLDPAYHPGVLVSRYPVDSLLIRHADRFVWGKERVTLLNQPRKLLWDGLPSKPNLESMSMYSGAPLNFIYSSISIRLC